MKRIPLLLVCLLSFLLPAACSRASGGPPADLDTSTTRLSDRGLYRVTIHPGAEPIPTGRIHSWTLHLESAAGDTLDDADIRVRGAMPEHGHGLPTTPQVTAALGGGDYVVEGMKFNMAGWWTLTFDVTVGGETDSVTFNVVL